MDTRIAITANARQSSKHILGFDGSDVIPQTTDLLRRLTEWEYVVPHEHSDAMQVLVNPDALSVRPSVITRADRCGREQRMEIAVAGFAASFFRLPPYQRRKQWQTLVEGCNDLPRLLHWLRNLEIGLNVENVPSSSDERLNKFVALCCEIFVARQPERARRRQELIAMYWADPQTWGPVAQELRLQRARFLTDVAGWTGLVRIISLEQNRNAPLRPIVRLAAEPQKAEKPEKESRAWIWIAVAAFSILRLVAAFNRSSSPNDLRPHATPYVAPYPIPNSAPVQSDLPFAPQITPEQVRAYKAVMEYRNRKQSKETVTASSPDSSEVVPTSEQREQILKGFRIPVAPDPAENSPATPTTDQ